MAETYRLPNWHDLTGKLYMPALEKCAVNLTNRRHEFPTFYQIQGYLAFFQPLLKEPVLVVSHKEVIPIIQETIDTKLMHDSSLGSLPAKNKSRISFAEQGLPPPDFFKTWHSEEAKNFAEFVDEAVYSCQPFMLCQALELMYLPGQKVDKFTNAVIDNFGCLDIEKAYTVGRNSNRSTEDILKIMDSLDFDKVIPSLKHVRDYLIFRSMDEVYKDRRKNNYVKSLKKSSKKS